jgi:hypothetical protein
MLRDEVLEEKGGIGPGFSSIFLYSMLHCKKRLMIFPSSAGMSQTKLSLAGKKFFIV